VWTTRFITYADMDLHRITKMGRLPDFAPKATCWATSPWQIDEHSTFFPDRIALSDSF